MVHVPPEVQIRATIRRGSVYYFADDRLSSAESHYFIVLNKTPRSDTLLILVCATSQILKRQHRNRMHGNPPETLVVISPNQFPCFTKETAIDCNKVFDKTIEAIIEKLSKKELSICAQYLPETIVGKLINGIKASPQIANVTKENLSD